MSMATIVTQIVSRVITGVMLDFLVLCPGVVIISFNSSFYEVFTFSMLVHIHLDILHVYQPPTKIRQPSHCSVKTYHSDIIISIRLPLLYCMHVQSVSPPTTSE